MSNNPVDANALLMGGGVKAAKFDTLGTVVVGTIVDPPKAQQMKKYQSEELDFWPSGDPKMQIVVTLQTDQHDDPDDDGRRNLFIVPRMMPPVREAVKKAGAPGLEVGGRLAVKWVSGTGQGQGNPKVYAAEYARPAVDPGSLLNSTTAPASATTPPAAPAGSSTAAQALGLANQSAGLERPAGIDPAAWDAMPVEQRQAILAAMSSAAATAAPF